MKLSDISQTLTEKPGGFGGIMKAKAQQQIPFAKKQQRAGKAKEALYKHARQIKKELQAWKAEIFATTNGEDTPLTMNQFLGWVNKRQPKYSKGIEAYARGDRAYAEHFAQAIDNKGKQSSTATDPKVKRRSPDDEGEAKVKGEQSKDEIQAAYKKQGDELEAKRIAQGGELVDEDEENEEKESPTSASIYEARLHALLEANEDEPDPDVDIGVNAAKTLTDNQIDTLITMGIQKQKELNSGDDDIASDEEISVSSSSGSSEKSGGSSVSDSFLEEYSAELESVLTKVIKGAKFDKRDQQSANNMLNSL